MNILNLYASLNGQTQKVAEAIEQSCTRPGCSVTTFNIRKENKELELLDYDLTFIGSGVYTWLPGKQMLKWIGRQLDSARDAGLILPGAPRIPGKFACVYCTYAGPHTGEAEAIPAIKYMGQLFDHLGISVFAEWAIPGAFVPEKMQSMNHNGRLGDIEDRPNARDLQEIAGRAQSIIDSIAPCVSAAGH